MEKVAQQLAGAPFLDAPINFRSVMCGWLVEQAGAVLDRAALRIVRPEIEPAEPGERDRRGAHRARFEGDVEIAFGQARGAELGGTRPQYEHLGMCRRVAIGLDAIAGGGEDTAVAIDQHSTDRYIAESGRRLSFRQSQHHR